MTSESSVTDQSIDEHAEEKEVVDVSKCVDGEEIIIQPREAAGKVEADNSKEEGLTGIASTASFSEEKPEVSNSSELAVETVEGNLQRKADDVHEMPSEVQEKSSDFVETSASQEPVISESKTEDLKDIDTKPTSEDKEKQDEAPLVSTSVDISEVDNVEAETLEAANPESSEDKVGIELIKSEDSKDEIQELVPAEIPTAVVYDASEVPEQNEIDSGNPISINVPEKVVEVECGSPEEQKLKESTETKEPSSNTSTIDAGGEVVGSSSYEVKPSEVSEVVVRKDDGLEVEAIQTSVKIQEDLEAITKLAETDSNENVSQEIEVKKDDEIFEGGIETSTIPDDVPPLDKVSSEEEKASKPGVLVQEEEESSLESDNVDYVPKVADVSLEDRNGWEEDKLVDKEKVVNAEAVERDLVDTITDPTEAEVPTTIEVENETLEVISKELNIAPEAIEVFSEGDKISAGDEESESLKGEEATSVEAPTDITTTEELLDHVIEEKQIESSASEKQVPSKDELVDKEKYVNEEAKEIKLQSQADDTHENLTIARGDFTEKSASQELVFSESKTHLNPAETPTAVDPDASEAPEKNDIDSSNLTNIEVPVKELEVESGSPKEQKSNESTKTKEPSSNVGAINAEGEVVESSFNEVKPSEVAEVIEKKNESLEVETIQASVKIQEDLEAKPELALTQSVENVFEEVKVKNDDEIVEPDIKISTVPDDISPLAKISYDEEKASEPDIVVEEETSLEGSYIDAVPKVAEVSFEGGNVLEGDTLVDKETFVNAEAVERDLVDTSTDPEEVTSVQIKSAATEIVNDSLGVTSNELNIAPEASEVPSETDKLSAGDEKIESLKGEAATSVVAPIDITTAEESLDQAIEEKSESSLSDTQASSEDKLFDKEKDVNEEAKRLNSPSQADGADETPSFVQSDFPKTSTSQELVFAESKNEDLEDTEVKPTSENGRKQEEAPFVSTSVETSEDGNVVAEKLEEANPESSKDKVDVELIKSEDSKDEIQVIVPDKIPTVVVPDASESLQKNDLDSNNLTSIEVPVKDLEAESGSPEEQKSWLGTDTKEPSSNASAIDVGGEVVGFSSYEIKPLGDAQVVETKDDGLEVETIQASVKIQEDLEAKRELAQTQSDENVLEEVKVKNDDEIVEPYTKISTVPDDISPLAKFSNDEEKASEPGTVVEEEASLEDNYIDSVPKVAEVSFEGGNVLEGDTLVDKETFVNAEAVERDLVDTSTDPEEVTCVQIKSAATEIVNDPLGVTSNELNSDPEASEVLSEAENFSAGDENIESLKGGAATSVVAPIDITTAEDSLDRAIEEKSESSLSETQASFEEKVFDKEKDVNEETKKLNSPSQADGADETPSVVQSDFAETSTSQEPVFSESKNEDLEDTEVKPTSENGREQEEEPFISTSVDISEEGNVVAETLEAANPESSKDKVDIELTKSEDSKDEIQMIVPDKIPTAVVPDASESPQKNDLDSSNLTSIEVPVEDLEVESGSPEEQKSWLGTDTKDPSSNVSAIDAGGEVVGSSSYESKPLGGSQVVETKDDGLEVETIQTSVKILGDLEAKPELGQTEFDQNVSLGVQDKKGDEIVEGDIDASTVPADVPLLAEVLSEEEKASEPSVVVEEEVSSLKSDSIDTVSKVAEVSLEGGNVLEGDELIDKEKHVNAVAVEKGLIDTITNPRKAEVSSDQVKAPISTEIVNEGLQVASMELNTSPKASEVPAEVDKSSVGDEEKSERLVVGEATSVEVPNDIISIKESFHQFVEKGESSVSEMAVPTEYKLVDKEENVNVEDEERDLINTSTDAIGAEDFSEQVKAPEFVEEETYKQALEETSKELNLAPEAATSVEASKDITTIDESVGQVIENKKNESSISEKKASAVPSEGDEVSVGDEEKRETLKGEEGSKSEMETLAVDKLVDKEKDVIADAEKTNFDTSSDLSAAVLISEHAKVIETADVVNESYKEALDVTSKELNVVHPLEGEKASSGEEEKSESLKGEDVTSLEAAKDIIPVEKSVDQLIEENNSKSSENETEALIETTRDFDTSKLFPEAVKGIIASEEAEKKQDETSRDLDVAEKKANESEDKEEVIVEGVLDHETDRPEQEELGAKEAESEKSKDQDPIVSPDSGDAKLSKEVSKRESNIFSKVKRSIVKAKKAILRKSPGPKTVSSQAKD